MRHAWREKHAGSSMCSEGCVNTARLKVNSGGFTRLFRIQARGSAQRFSESCDFISEVRARGLAPAVNQVLDVGWRRRGVVEPIT